jgi:hypothetical protein
MNLFNTPDKRLHVETLKVLNFFFHIFSQYDPEVQPLKLRFW